VGLNPASPDGASHPFAEARGIPRPFHVNREGCLPLPRMRAFAGARLGIVLVPMVESLDAALREAVAQRLRSLDLARTIYI